MNILTKICVVVLLVLVLFSSGVFISSAVTPDNWRTLYNNQLARAEQATTYALNTQLALRQEQLNRDALSKELQSAKSDSAKQVGALATDLATANTKLAEKEAALSAASTNLTKSLANQEMAMGESKIKDGLLTEARKQLAQANSINQELDKTVNQLRGESERYAYQLHSMEVTIREQQEYITQLIEQKGQPAAGTGTSTAETPSGEVPKVEGQITAVQGNVASVNIGSAKGIKKGMTLIIYRGLKVVGKLTISDEPDLSSAAGNVTDAQMEVKQGDMVITKLN